MIIFYTKDDHLHHQVTYMSMQLPLIQPKSISKLLLILAFITKSLLGHSVYKIHITYKCWLNTGGAPLLVWLCPTLIRSGRRIKWREGARCCTTPLQVSKSSSVIINSDTYCILSHTNCQNTNTNLTFLANQAADICWIIFDEMIHDIRLTF